MKSTVARPVPGFTSAVQLKEAAGGFPALFIFPGLGGVIDALAELAASIELPLKIYAFQSRGIEGAFPPDTQVEEMVDQYLAELTRLQVNGPYLLCGHSLGGLVAFETARRMRASGAEVGALILLDTPIHQSLWPRSFFLSVLLQRLRHHLSVIIALPPRKIVGYLARTFRMMINAVLTYLRLANPVVAAEENLTPAMKEVWTHQIAAWANYRPLFYPDKMIYFVAAIPEWAPLDPDVMWRGRVKELEVHIVAGGHRSMLDQPYVSQVASTLADCLRPFCAGKAK